MPPQRYTCRRKDMNAAPPTPPSIALSLPPAGAFCARSHTLSLKHGVRACKPGLRQTNRARAREHGRTLAATRASVRTRSHVLGPRAPGRAVAVVPFSGRN
eukprot:5997211-Pleurochrysis_carterae.AAC.2